MPSTAIIGAGSSGLAAAHILQDAGYTVTAFEKNQDVGGRAATRKRAGFIYDSGAQYIKGGSPASDALITGRFRLPDLVNIAKPVWIFDRQGHISEGDPLQNAHAKWTYRSGLAALPKRMAQELDIRLETPIVRVEQTAPGWSLYTGSEKFVGQFEQLLITIPAIQAAELIEACKGPIYSDSTDLRESTSSSLRRASYNPLISVMLGYKPAPEARPYYALVNTDKAHPISWLAWEHEKAPERAPEGSGLLIAQMAPRYSREHEQAPSEEIIRDVASRVAELLDEPLTGPVFSDIQHWRCALPAEKANAGELNAATLPVGLAFCGDGFVGGRVHLALEHGMTVARQLITGQVKE